MRKDELMTIRVPKAIKQTIKRQAAEMKRTIPNQALVLIELGLRGFEKSEQKEAVSE